MKPLPAALSLLLTACGELSDDDLKRQAAEYCGIAPGKITLWDVQRDPKTGKAIAIASAGDYNGRCAEDWKYRNNIMSTFY